MHENNAFVTVAITLCLALAMVSSSYAGELATTAVYTGEVLRNVDGGAQRGTAYLGNVDVDAQWKPTESERFTAYFHVLADHGDAPSELIGDAQGVSNISAPDAVRIYEAWVDYRLGSFSVRTGLYDLNSEFDVVDTAGLFSNSSFGVGPELSQAGPLGPSIFPYTGLAIRARTERDGKYIQFAMLDGMPGDKKDPRKPSLHLSRSEGALLVAESGVSGTTLAGRAYKFAAGAWHFTADFARVDTGARQHGNSGAYAFADAVLAQWDTASVSGFMQLGVADDRVNGVGNYFGAGVVASGFLAARPKDRVGLALARAAFADDARAADGLRSAEIAIEANYELPLTEWLTLQPNVQRVIHPGGDPTLGNAWVIGTRVILSYAP